MNAETSERPASAVTRSREQTAEGNSYSSLSDAVRSAGPLEVLEAMRNQIAIDLDNCEQMRDKAALYLRLADVLARIEQMRPAKQEGDLVDEIAARRAARRSVATARSARSHS